MNKIILIIIIIHVTNLQLLVMQKLPFPVALDPMIIAIVYNLLTGLMEICTSGSYVFELYSILLSSSLAT
jgi:hypothetical protein